MAALPNYIRQKIQQDSVENLNQRYYEVQYGDGYSQRASVGINSNYLEWEVRVWPLTQPEMLLFRQFWREHGYVESWDWEPPTDSQIRKWVFVTPLSITNVAEVYEATFTCREVFE